MTSDRRPTTTYRGLSFVAGLLSLVVALSLGGCGAKQGDRARVLVRTLAVLPIEPDAGKAKVAPEAGDSVTAQIYRVLADQTRFRFVADLTVADTVIMPEVRNAGGLKDRAVALGKQVEADAVIFGQVFRYQKRVGTQFGASEPASVGFELRLVIVSTGEVVWTGAFDETQQPLTSNLFNWWMIWGGGPRWLSAGELAGLGVDRLFDDMSDAVVTEES